MNLKKKLTSALSLVLVLSMLLSSAAMATDLADAEAGSASSSSSEPVEPTEPVANDPDASTEEPTEPAEPTEPTTPEEPTVEPAADPEPAVMTAAKGWAVGDNGAWAYTYTGLDGNDVLAGDPKTYPSGKVQVLYVPEQACAVGDTTVTRTAGFYAFSNGVWLKDYTTITDGKDNPVLFNGVTEVEIRQDGHAYQLDSKDCKYTGSRLMSFKVTDSESKGELFTGRWINPKNNVRYRYKNGALYTGYGLGTEKTPNLYYYYKGLYQKTTDKSGKTIYDGKKSVTAMKSNSGYHLFEGKLYYASTDTLSKKKTSPYASPFTGRWINEEDGVKRRYEKGVPYNGFGLGTQSTPCLYYYVDGLYQKTKDKHGKIVYDGIKSREELESYLGDGKVWNGKLYVATEATLVGTKTQPYATPLTGYRIIDGKLYTYTKGTGVLFTGRWTNPDDGVKRRYEKGVPYNGFGLGTQSTPCLYYYVDGLYQKTKDKHGKVIYNGEKSKVELEAYLDNGKVWNGKLYVATEATLVGTNTQPYAVPLTGYRMVNGKMYKYTKGTGVLFTGVYNGTESSLKQYKGHYFSKGVKQKLPDGWKTVGGKRYYNKNDKPLVGWHYVKCNGNTYYYYFKDGAQVKDLFAHFGKSYLKKKMVVNVNRPNHTVDMLLYNSKTKKYDIPAKSFVTTTPEENAHFKTGSYKLTYRRKWWSFKNPKTGKVSYYQYATRVDGTYGALIHSSRYTAKSVKALAWKTYNNLGANRSYYCIRVQCGNAKLIYDCVGAQGSGKVLCKFSNSKTQGPNGKVTMANSGGKVKPGTKMDPTDPAAKKK